MSDKLLGVDEVARLAGVSKPTIFRWARDPDNAGKLPPAIHAPGKPQRWPQSAVEQWLASFGAVRSTERALEAFADSEELDPILQRVARTAARLLRSTEIPIRIRQQLTQALGRIQWERGTETLSAEDKRRARRALLQLLAFSGEVCK